MQLQRSVVVDAEIVRRADGQVRPRGADHRAERDLDRVDHVDPRVHGQLEHELAVLALADLQERPLVGRPDVVALRVHEHDLRAFAGDLATEDERGRGVGADRAQPVRCCCTTSG